MSEPDFLIATRDSYERVAEAYAQAGSQTLKDRPWDRALLSLFAELVLEAAGPRVADVGCGPGYVTDHLNRLGLEAFGVDLSPAMLERARRNYPDLEFRTGTVLDLGVTDHSLDGIVAQYSFNTVPPEHLSRMFEQFHRCLRPGGLALLAFTVREEPLDLTSWLDQPVALPLQRLVPEDVENGLTAAGFRTQARALRNPRPPHEARPHAVLIVEKPRLTP